MDNTNAPLKEFDFVVIGSGEAGSSPAFKCREAGWSVAVVDREPFGGTCALRGCDPKKVLVGAADVADWHRRMIDHGVAGDTRIDWPRLMRFKESFTAPVSPRREARFRDVGISTFHGQAAFEERDLLVVNGDRLRAKHIVLAVGARPRSLRVPGEEHLVTSTQFLSLESLPRRIVLVGAGYIAFEFAHIAARAGADVTLVGRTALAQFDADLVGKLMEHTKSLGVTVELGAEVTGVEEVSGAGVRIHCTRDDATFSIDADVAVHTAGRVPDVDGLRLERGGVKLDAHRAIEVDDYLRSVSNPLVYAAGDAVRPAGKLPLTPVAAHEGAIVASNLLRGPTKRPDYRGTPSVVFTIPPLASVGLTERAARNDRLEITVKSEDTSAWYTNRRTRTPVGAFKTIVGENGRLVGAHLLGDRADETINLLALAIRLELPLAELRHAIYAYPSSGSDLPFMI